MSEGVVLIGFWDAFLRRSHHCGHDGIVERRLFLCGLLQDLNKSVSMTLQQLREVTSPANIAAKRKSSCQGDPALHNSWASAASYPARSAEHLEVQRVSGELTLDPGQRVAGGHAGDKPGGRRPFLSDIWLWRREATAETSLVCDWKYWFQWLRSLKKNNLFSLVNSI